MVYEAHVCHAHARTTPPLAWGEVPSSYHNIGNNAGCCGPNTSFFKFKLEMRWQQIFYQVRKEL